MKRIAKIAIIVAALLAMIWLVACDASNGAETTAQSTASQTEAQTEETTAAATENTTEVVTTTNETQEEETEVSTEAYTGPRKYFTLSFDDGITQDRRMMEIMRKYGVDCCTFNINTGVLGLNTIGLHGTAENPAGVSHQRFTKEEIEGGVYDGFDVQCHTQTHPILANLTPDEVKTEVSGDAKKIKRLTGTAPVGMAWPNGDAYWNEENIKTILETTDIRFARAVARTGTFDLPTYFMTWYPTCSANDDDLETLTAQFIAAKPEEDILFYVWGHGYEFDLYDSWDRFEWLIATISEAAKNDPSITLVTNAEFYEIYKDRIPSWVEVETTED